MIGYGIHSVNWRTKNEALRAEVRSLDDRVKQADEHGDKWWRIATDLVVQVRELRQLLRALVEVGPPSDDNHSSFACCGNRWSRPHAADCPWLLAKHYLEAHQQDAPQRAESHQEPLS